MSEGAQVIVHKRSARDVRVFYRLKAFGLGAKSQILSSVAPPRKKKLVTIFSQGHVWGPQKPMFY